MAGASILFKRKHQNKKTMEYIETIVTLRTYRRNGKKASKWLRKKEKEGFIFDSSESMPERRSGMEPDLKISVTKLEPFK